MINNNKIMYIEPIVQYIKSKPEVNKLVVYGESINPDISEPESIDFAVGLVNDEDATNYALLGDILSFIGDIVDDGDCSLVPISEKILSKACWEEVNNGEVLYE